jgi:hypothetical protein
VARQIRKSPTNSNISGQYGAPFKMEDHMDNLVAIGQFWGGSFGFFGGLGVFFVGIGVLWWVSLRAKKE